MKRSLAVLIIVIGVLFGTITPIGPAFAAESELPKPILVLVEYDPWRMVIGSDSPSFALYENGQIIYRTDKEYVSAALSPEDRFRLLTALDPAGRARNAKSYYNQSNATDQVTSRLYIDAGGVQKTIMVYGPVTRSRYGQDIPSELVDLFDGIKTYSNQQARPWLPDHIEVMIWPYTSASKQPVHWPDNWPGIDHPLTKDRGKDNYSLFLDKAHLPALMDLLEERKSKGSLEIDGRKWAAAVRFPFPSEDAWMKASTE